MRYKQRSALILSRILSRYNSRFLSKPYPNTLCTDIFLRPKSMIFKMLHETVKEIYAYYYMDSICIKILFKKQGTIHDQASVASE